MSADLCITADAHSPVLPPSRNRPVVTSSVYGLLLLLALAMPARAQTGSDTEQAPANIIAYVNRVLDAHPRVLAARSSVTAAEARARAAGRPLYNPELDAEYEDGDLRRQSVGLNQTIDLGNKRAARQGVASAEQQAAREALALVRQQVSAELLAAAGGLNVATDLASIAGERKALMARFRETANERRAAGDLNQVEAQLAELAYAEAALLYAQSLADQVSAEQDLARVVGTALPAPPPLPSDYARVTLSEASVDSILNTLPSVRVAQAQIAASRATLALRQRERRPDPTIGLFAGREGDDDLIGLRFSIPLPVRNPFRAEVDAATADLDTVTLGVDDTYRQLRAELVAAAKRYEISRAAWQEWQAVGAGSLERQIQVLEQLWRAGELSTSAYLVQLEQALDTQMAGIEQRGAVWADWIAWLAVSGRVDAWMGFGGTR